MTSAHLSPDDYAAIAKAYSAALIETHSGSVEAGDWPKILGADLFKRAVEGGYFGPKGTIRDLDYSVGTVQGAQVRGTSQADGSILYELFVDGEVVASEKGRGNFDTVAFAKKHGQAI